MSEAIVRLTEKTQEQYTQLNNLTEQIYSRILYPEDPYEIAAILESMGWNDERVQESFGAENIFVLASEIWQTNKARVSMVPIAPSPRISLWRKVFVVITSFLRGFIFALPMAISVISMLTLKMSLWSYEHLTVDLATSIAIGTILSFVVVGGYTQAIARRGFFYLFQGYYNMGRRITFYFIRLGYVTAVLAAGLVYLFNLIFNIFPQQMFFYIAAYFFFLTSIWLSVTVMYILRKELAFTGLIVLGIGEVYVLKEIMQLDIIWSQLISILSVSILGMVLVIYYFKSAEKREEKGIAPRLPRPSITLYAIAPYFIYGFLYFLFLFVDRMIAWSVNQEYMPYVIWFRGEYELGLDFSLLVLMIPLGVSEVIVNKFMIELEAGQKGFWGFETGTMKKVNLSRYYANLAIIAFASLISAVFVYGLFLFTNQWYLGYAGNYLISNPTTMFVFLISLISYVILAIALMNSVILFSLSQPNLVTHSLLPALAANVVVGFFLSRWIDYSYAIFGLLAGTVIFAVLSTLQLRRVIGKIDYYLYAAS